MATDFNNKSAMPKPLFVGSSLLGDLPLDIRTRIETIDEMSMIQFPYIGMMVYVKDEDKFYVTDFCFEKFTEELERRIGECVTSYELNIRGVCAACNRS